MFSKFEISKKLMVHTPYTKYYTLSWSDNGCSEGTMQFSTWRGQDGEEGWWGVLTSTISSESWMSPDVGEYDLLDAMEFMLGD